MERWKRPLVHSCLLQKKAPSPWNFHGEGHLSDPDLGLASSNFPCEWRMAARLFTDWSVWGCCAPSCASYPASALRCSSAAWRLAVAPRVRHYKLAMQVSINLCSIGTVCKLPHISRSAAQLSWVANFNQETSGNSMGFPEMSYLQSACTYVYEYHRASIGLICKNSP